jgi:hypothetical protein
VVDFEEPTFELLVQHDIEAQQFKTAVRFFLLATPVDVGDLWL